MVGFLFSLCCFAQKKQLQVVKEQVKAGKELDKAEKTLQGLLDDSIYRKENRIWLLLCDVLIKQYELGNEKLYLKQQYDTTAFFSITRKLYDTMSRFDTLDASPSSIGKIQPKYRLKHSIFLNSIRPNLFNGGSFFIQSSKDINDPNIPTLLHISHRLPIHFATTISQMTNGKFHMTSVQFYFFLKNMII